MKEGVMGGGRGKKYFTLSSGLRISLAHNMGSIYLHTRVVGLGSVAAKGGGYVLGWAQMDAASFGGQCGGHRVII